MYKQTRKQKHRKIDQMRGIWRVKRDKERYSGRSSKEGKVRILEKLQDVDEFRLSRAITLHMEPPVAACLVIPGSGATVLLPG